MCKSECQSEITKIDITNILMVKTDLFSLIRFILTRKDTERSVITFIMITD